MNIYKITIGVRYPKMRFGDFDNTIEFSMVVWESNKNEAKEKVESFVYDYFLKRKEAESWEKGLLIEWYKIKKL